MIVWHNNYLVFLVVTIIFSPTVTLDHINCNFNCLLTKFGGLRIKYCWKMIKYELKMKITQFQINLIVLLLFSNMKVNTFYKYSEYS